MCDPSMSIRLEVLGDALALFQDCFRLRRQVLGEDHPNTQESCTWLNECKEALEIATKEFNEEAAKENSQVDVGGFLGRADV